jgi:DNA-binding MarR family transcriptional regulator
MNIEETLDYQVRATLFSMMRMYNLLAQENKITQGIGYVLIVVPKEGMPATKVAPALGMGSSSLGRLLKGMEKSGLITKRVSKKDKRITKIFLTPEGVKLRRSIKESVIKFNEQVMNNISSEELTTYNKVSEIIRMTAEKELEKKIISNQQ